MEPESRMSNLRFYTWEDNDIGSAVTIEELDAFAKKQEGEARKIVIGDNVELLEFEEMDMSLFECAFVPEVVTRHPDFFAALASVGLNVIGNKIDSKFVPHQRRFNLLETVTFMTGPKGHILGFDVPTLGCEFLRENVMKNISYYDGEKVIGNGEDVCYGVREKIDGTEAVVFRVKYENEDEYYLWNSEKIVQVKASQPFHCEKMDGRYYILSPVLGDFVFKTMDDKDYSFVIHDFQTFSRDLYQSAGEGLIFNINFKEYKVCRLLTFTFKVEGNVAYDSTRKMAFGVNGLKDGMYDFSFDRGTRNKKSNVLSFGDSAFMTSKYLNVTDVCIKVGEYKGEDLYFVKMRRDRVYPDSFQHIEVTREKCISYARLLNYIPVVHKAEILIGIPLYFRDSTGCEMEYEEGSLPQILVSPSRLEVDDQFVSQQMHDLKVVGRGMSTPVQERVYFQNMYDTTLVVKMIVPKKRDKGYISWSDCFLAFHRYKMVHRRVVDGRIVWYSNEFDETDFFRFCVDRCLYQKDGMAYDLCMYKVMMQKGFKESVYKKKLVVSKNRRKFGKCFAYRQFYVWFDSVYSVRRSVRNDDKL